MFVQMEAIDADLSQYLDRTCDSEPALLAKIHRETYLKETMPHMVSGHFQGRLLAMFSKLISPRRILEVGTFTGYATLCLAEGMCGDAEIHTIDINAELEDRVRGYFSDSGLASQIHYHIGAAVDIIPQLPSDFDLVFIDADKNNNYTYFELALEKARPGALILIDNVLWKGKVLDDDPDKQTRQIMELNTRLTQDNRIEKLILPVRDGLFVLRKK